MERGNMPESYVDGYLSPKMHVFGICGIFERKKFSIDISKAEECEICISKPRILMQGIFRGRCG